MLEVARRNIGDFPIALTQGDARALTWPADSFDIATCLGVLHHFDEIEACEVLREMWRVARVGIVVVDLVRSYPLYLGAWLATHTVVQNRFHRHDGPISVLRSYTSSEMRALGQDAGLPAATVHRHRLFLQSLVARRT
jgi:ubiquinone/menaquinone biosynthesis C-methylase UbiE